MLQAGRHWAGWWVSSMAGTRLIKRMIERPGSTDKAQQTMRRGGGGYAIAGFLYQLLGSIDFATSVAVSGQPKGTTEAYTVTVEPPSGGDAIHEADGIKATTQFKTRRLRPFTERDILVDVFPDLFKAAVVDPDQGFVLQTNGVASLSPESERFAELLREAPLEAALAQAEGEGLQFKAHQIKGKRTAREHYDWLASLVSNGQPTKENREALAALIRRFRIADRVDEATVRRTVMKRLRQLAGSHEAAQQLFLRLVGRLVILATTDHRTVTVAEVFADCDIDAARLVTTVQFVARLAEDARATMEALGYEAARDSRLAPIATLGALATALAGPSGVGKTWAMARAADEAGRDGAIVIWIDRPPNERDRLQALIVQRVQRARDRTSNANPLAMRSIFDMAAGAGPELRVCVCLDRLSSPAIAHDLITDPWWSENRIELMAALPAAEPDAVVFDSGARVIPIERFTLTEVRRFLKQRRIDWSSIPIDILKLLRTPALARQFAALGAPSFRPSDEYVLMQAAWRREPAGYVRPLRTAKAVLERRMDGMAAAILARTPVVYPWPHDASPPLSEAQIELLEHSGFVRWTRDGGLQLDTDRSLSWALAEAFARLVANGTLVAAELEPFLQRWWQGEDAVAGLARHALGYVPLDLLWLLAADGVTPSLLDLIKAITPGRRMLDWNDISTLGPRGAAIAEAFVVSLPTKDWPPFIKPLADALLADGMTPAIRRMASRFLRSRDREKRMLALELYVRHPDPRQLATLVTQRARFEAMSQAPGPGFHLDHHERAKLYEAAAAAARRRPIALLKLAAAPPPPSHVQTLAWLIGELNPTEALKAWREAASALEPPAHEEIGGQPNRHLLLLAEPSAVERLSSTQADDAFLFQAQCSIDPDAALARFVSASTQTRTAWLRYLEPLVRLRPSETQSAVLACLGDGRLSPEDLGRDMTGWSTLAVPAMWTAVLERTPPADEKALLALCRTLQSTATPAQLQALQACRGSQLEQGLLDLAKRHVADRSGRSADWDLKAASAALLRLGGPAFSELTLARLGSVSDIERRQGVEDALLCDDPRIGEALARDLQGQLDRGDGRVSQTDLDTLMHVAPARALELAGVWLTNSQAVGLWGAGEIALELDDRELGLQVLSRLSAVKGSANRRLEIRLLGWFRTDDGRLRKVVAQTLALDGSDGRGMALWAARRLEDESMFHAVEQALDEDLARSDYRDAHTISALSHHPVIGPRLLAKLRAKPRGHGLSRILADEHLAAEWSRDALFGELALDDALQFRSTFLNTPRDGQNRLWVTDPEMAFEVFAQGLRQGGRASEGLAAPAVRTSADRAVAILLQHVVLPENGKAEADIGRALRLAPVALLEPKILALLASEVAEVRIRGVVAAGWLATPVLDTAVLDIARADARPAVRAAVRNATTRSDRLSAMAALAAKAGSATGEPRWRLLALLAELGQDGVLRAYDDPLRLAIGELNDHDAMILETRLKS